MKSVFSAQDNQPSRSGLSGTLLTFLAAALALVFVIWLPFGFQLGGLIEEWGVLGLFVQRGPIFFAGAHSLLAAHRLRPFTVLPQALGFVLNPDSFVWWHVLLMACLVVKSVCAGCLLWYMTRTSRWAIFCGLLLVVYPADTMQLAFRSLHINFALSAMLLASLFQVSVYELQNRALQWSLAAAAAGTALTAVWSYEAALLFMPMPYMLMFVRHGGTKLWERLQARPWLALPWWGTAVFCVAYMGYVLTHGGTVYQVEVIGPLGAVAGKAKIKAALVGLGFFRALAGGWFDAARVVLREYANYLYLVLASLLCIGLAFGREIFRKKSPASETPGEAGNNRRWRRLVLMAFLLMVLGYAPYFTSYAHLHISQRTFLFASWGSVLLWFSAWVWIWARSRLGAVALGSGLLFLGLGTQLYQFNHYVKISQAQKRILREIVENVPDISVKPRVIIFDSSEQLGHTWMLREYLTSALTYFYGKNINEVMICLEPRKAWQKLDAFARPGQCRETENSWVFGSAAPAGKAAPDLVIAKTDALVLSVNQDGTITPTAALLPQRSRLAVSHDALSRRFRGVLNAQPWLRIPLFPDSAVARNYRWDFGKYWSLEEPTRGLGWQDAYWQVRLLHHVSVAWKNLPEADLMFSLEPLPQPYLLRGRFAEFAPGVKPGDLKFQINGQGLACAWQDGHEFSARVSPEQLVKGTNVLGFFSPSGPGDFGRDACLDWVSLVEVPGKSAQTGGRQ